jgi:hypothetical protein
MGELRANLVFPRGTATITYDPAAQPVLSNFVAPIGQQLSVSASIQVSLTGLNGGDVLQAHLHGPSFFGSNGPVFATLCNPCPTKPQSLPFIQTFTNVTIPNTLLESASAYINLHTSANLAGEARGQLAKVINPTTAPGANVGTSSLDVLQETFETKFSFVANSAQNVGVNIISQASALFDMSFNPATATITMSAINVQGLSSALQAIHIHGPCSGPCNAPVVFTICGPSGSGGNNSCPSSTSATVTSSPITGPLFHSILKGRSVYYLNIHTTL